MYVLEILCDSNLSFNFHSSQIHVSNVQIIVRLRYSEDEILTLSKIDGLQRAVPVRIFISRASKFNLR
ncbi:hypothetical protein DBV15_03793 [Temnothorax longispinosus]|uniref:Uncharacterized protein n=1 Tax=Temnothorax longispinosus TaxID=300112 RepID=A0A4S2JC87_9HYME|nr:hypothetical protein DBV15_03793 [Temnothorax longispinosus]